MRSRHVVPFAVLAMALLFSACTQVKPVSDDKDVPEDVDSIETPKLGVCRVLAAEDVEESSNASEAVDCKDEHTAETFTVGTFPKKLRDTEADDPALGDYIFDVCSKRFLRFVGGEESSVLRTTLTWAWFRPSDEAWDQGARWYRCDVIANGPDGELVALPKTANGLLLGKPPDEWMICVNAPAVVGAPRIPCTQPHNWRAVSTIVLGDTKDPYPGDRLVQVRTRDSCSDWVGAWLNYPVDFTFGYTTFHEAEWETGNRRSICWAQTNQ